MFSWPRCVAPMCRHANLGMAEVRTELCRHHILMDHQSPSAQALSFLCLSMSEERVVEKKMLLQTTALFWEDGAR